MTYGRNYVREQGKPLWSSDLRSAEKYLFISSDYFVLITNIIYYLFNEEVFKKEWIYVQNMQLTCQSPGKITLSLPEMYCFVIADNRKPTDELLKDPANSSLPYNSSCFINLHIIYINYWTLTLSPIKFAKIHVEVKITNYKTLKSISYSKDTLPIISW